MFKIKDGINLKLLENYGFKTFNSCLDGPNDKNLWAFRDVGNHRLSVNSVNRVFHKVKLNDATAEIEINKIDLQNLIKDDIVEVV